MHRGILGFKPRIFAFLCRFTLQPYHHANRCNAVAFSSSKNHSDTPQQFLAVTLFSLLNLRPRYKRSDYRALCILACRERSHPIWQDAHRYAEYRVHPPDLGLPRERDAEDDGL